MPEEQRTERGEEVKARSTPPAPTYESLPTARRNVVRYGSATAEIAVRVEVVTPILGGSNRTRSIDDVDVIRAATVRGHLRFWWRALKAHEYGNPKELYIAESALWGRAATDEGGRSAVEIRIEVEQAGTIDESDIRLYDSRDGEATPGAYALWPARAKRERGEVKAPPAPRRRPGTRYRLTLVAPEDREVELRNAVRAWLLFGGYGSRTRRGLGSFKVVENANTWLPASATREAFTVIFGRDVFALPVGSTIDVPWLGGAWIFVGKPDTDAVRAWTTALDWLKEFRQGTSGKSGSRAREPGANKQQPQRPSISNWPEADKIRYLSGKTMSHRPRYNDTPAWPRAGFGLPIIGQFQTKARDGTQLDEPGPFELRWRSGRDEHDRLASPLIVKALPFANGAFVPCALWLNRAYPERAEVGLTHLKSGGRPTEKGVDPRTIALFDQLTGSNEKPQFSALENKHSLKEAFFDWLNSHETTVVAR